MSGHRPIRLLERLLEVVLPKGLSGEGTLGDLAEGFDRRAVTSPARAHLWYLGQTASLVLYRLFTGTGEGSASANSALAMDLRWSLRLVLRHPGFALGVVAVLGLGLGTNVAVYSVVDGTFRNASWWAAPDRSFTLQPEGPFSFGQMEMYREDAAVYRSVGGWVEAAWALALPDGGSRSVNGVRITPELFAELQVQPRLGRALVRDDAWFGVEPVVVLGERLWRDVFGGDPEIVGRRIELSGVPHTVVGIQGRGGRAPGGRAELWTPLVLDPRDDDYFRAQNLTVVGVLGDGAGPEDAAEELAAFNDRLSDMWPGFYPAGWSDGIERVAPADETQRRLVSTPLLLLLGGTGLLLLVTALNVGNLLLGRAVGRQRELAVRASIGAGRGRIVSQLLVEGAVLTALACAVAIGGAAAGGPRIAALFVGEAIVAATPIADPRVLSFVLVAGGVAWVVLSGVPIGSFLLHGVQGIRGSALRGARLQQSLVAVQAALATLLLVSATLLVQTVANLRAVPLGFEDEGLVAVELSPVEDRIESPAAARDFYDRLLGSTREAGGVRSVGITGYLPLRRLAPETPLNLESRPTDPAQAVKVPMHLVDGGFFEAMGVRAVRGRVLNADDRGSAPSSVVVNESLAALLWPQGNAIGQRIAIDPHAWTTFLPVVGVVPDIRSGSVSEPPGPAIYTAVAEQPIRDLNLVVRVERPFEQMAPLLREAIAEADPLVAIRSIESMTEVVRSAYAISWIVMGLVVLLSVLATGLGAIGIYAVLAEHVARGRREMGVHMALGAEPARVIRGIVGSGVGLAGAGIAVGCLLALAGARLLESMLFGVTTLSPTAYLVPALLLLTVATLAAWIPAARAGRLAPAEALRG